MFDHKKAIQVINWFARKAGGEIGKQKLMCLMFIADREHMRRYGRFICGGSYFVDFSENGEVSDYVKDQD